MTRDSMRSPTAPQITVGHLYSLVIDPPCKHPSWAYPGQNPLFIGALTRSMVDRECKDEHFFASVALPWGS